MENTGNFYDDTRKGNTEEANALANTQAQNTEAKISDSFKWASRIFTGFAICGWIIAVILLIDATFNNANLITRIMAG